ncbi:hypothetical protein BC826DRAFT_1101047 [Russula brevipes]|nr:hypothetical protein BC826DRAFT_1101047 [Russula brevipes]
MSRPVLVDLPLERFLQAVSDDSNLATPRTGSKRSRSPSLVRSIFTPAKRRILEQEGLFPPSQSRPYPSTSTRTLRHHRSGALLHAFDDPKCPLGSSPASRGDALIPSPLCHPHALVLPSSREEPRRISPRLSASPQQSKSHPTATTPTRVSPRKKTRAQTTTTMTTTSSTTPSSSQRACRNSSTPSSSSPPPLPTPTMIPREIPPLPDRRSVHYPGFDVHQDTHVAVPCTRSKARAKAEMARIQEGGEAAKENVRPVVMPVQDRGGSKVDKVKVKGKGVDGVPPRRSARLRTNSVVCSLQKAVVVPEARGHGRRRSTVRDSCLQF